MTMRGGLRGKHRLAAGVKKRVFTCAIGATVTALTNRTFRASGAFTAPVLVQVASDAASVEGTLAASSATAGA